MESCIKCGKKATHNELQVNMKLNEWLCFDCNDLYITEFKKFNKNFIQPERSKREDQVCTCIGKIVMEEDPFECYEKGLPPPKTYKIHSPGCGALNIVETQ